jgi:membrane associated rhomboid family serine protease
MVAAPVGFQCPECVAKAESSVRSPLTPMGGQVVETSSVTKTIIGINAVVFLLELLVGMEQVINRWGMWPYAISVEGEWWRLLSAAFLHGGLLHIGFNMYVLWMIGPTLESLFGHVRFIVLYLVAALGGSVASYAFSPLLTVSVGASGAIFGLMAALIVAGHHLKRDVRQVLILLGINVVIGFLAPGIDWRAHLGGAVVGALIAAIMAYAPKQGRVLWQTLGVLAVLGILTTILVLRTVQIQQELLQLPVG